ncbi:MAG: DUF1786 family protein [Archaeoglobaceae archaeon]
METVFTLDVGSTTQDLFLLTEQNLRNCPKAILPSPTRIIARKIEKRNEDIFLHGYTMGGGAITRAVLKHIKKGYKVFSTERAALTFADNLEKVKEMGIIIAEDANAFKIKTADVDMEFFLRMMHDIGIEMPEIYAIAVQDHGFSPFESNRIFRFRMFRRIIEREKFLENLLFDEKNLPREFNRMADAVASVKDFVDSEVYVTDTSFAAIAGLASVSKLPALLINFGNSHTTAAIVDDCWEIKAIVEHHTNVLKKKGKEYVLEFFSKFLKGEIDNDFVLNDMGHGCYVREIIEVKQIVATGPNSWLSNFEEPKGDPMIFGNIGMIAMLTRRGLLDFKSTFYSSNHSPEHL